MGQIIKSLASVGHSVILSVCQFVNTPKAAILIRFWWNFAQWFGARKVRSSLFGIKIW